MVMFAFGGVWLYESHQSAMRQNLAASCVVE